MTWRSLLAPSPADAPPRRSAPDAADADEENDGGGAPGRRGRAVARSSARRAGGARAAAGHADRGAAPWFVMDENGDDGFELAEVTKALRMAQRNDPSRATLDDAAPGARGRAVEAARQGRRDKMTFDEFSALHAAIRELTPCTSSTTCSASSRAASSR